MNEVAERAARQRVVVGAVGALAREGISMDRHVECVQDVIFHIAPGAARLVRTNLVWRELDFVRGLGDHGSPSPSHIRSGGYPGLSSDAARKVRGYRRCLQDKHYHGVS